MFAQFCPSFFAEVQFLSSVERVFVRNLQGKSICCATPQITLFSEFTYTTKDIAILRSRSHVFRYFWKQRQFTPRTSVHRYKKFSGTKNAGFRNRTLERSFSKTLALIFFFVWKDKNGGYFRIPRCHTSYSACQESDAIEATQKIISFFQDIRIRVDETCILSYHYSHTRITRTTKVIHEPLRSHDTGRFLVQSILSCRELWSMRV